MTVPHSQPHSDYTTTDAGIPAQSDEHSLTAGPNGPILLQDHYLIEKMAQFNRERVPERVVHAKGGGAFGVLRGRPRTSASSRRPTLFQPGHADRDAGAVLDGRRRARQPRHLARPARLRDQVLHRATATTTWSATTRRSSSSSDPQKFQDFIHSQKRRADNHLRDNNMQWDFWTLSPESAHMVTWLMGDRGLPRSWRHMNGYSSHTFSWINAAGEKFWVKYHFKTDQGVEHLSQAEGDRLAGEDTEHHKRDLCDRDRVRRPPVLDAVRTGHAVRRRRRTTASTRST